VQEIEVFEVDVQAAEVVDQWEADEVDAVGREAVENWRVASCLVEGRISWFLTRRFSDRCKMKEGLIASVPPRDHRRGVQA
jgi:hypothetical protein